VELLTLQL
jgi:DNA helicase IV